MATYLYRVGGWAFEHRWRVAGIWAAVIAIVFACASAFSGQTNDKFEVPGTESQQAQDLLAKKFPEASGASARVVYAAPRGESLTSPGNSSAVEASLKQASRAQDVIRVVDPYTAHTISRDGRIGYADVIYPVPEGEIDQSARDELEHIAGSPRAAGLQVEFGGGVVKEESKTNSESAGLMIGLVVLAITLASLLAAGMPLFTAIIGVVIGITGITAFSGVITVSSATPTLATMLGLAVGIDYALFILSRYRQHLADGYELREAAALSVATAGSAVVFAGSTVVIALVGLLVVGIPFLSVMGISAAVTVAIAVMIALTLLPALFGLAGERLRRSNRALTWRPPDRKAERTPMGRRWATFVTRRKVPVLVAGIAALVLIASPATDLRLGLPDGGNQPKGDTEREAYDLLTEGFGPGFNGTLTGVIDAPNMSQAERDRIGSAIVQGLQKFPGVATVSSPIHNQNGELTIVQVTPTSGPASQQTEDLVNELRDRAKVVHQETGVDPYITGTTALNIDTSTQLSNALPGYVLVVVGLALLLLTIVFRSILVPIKAAAGFLLTIAAAMGITVWIF